VLMPGRVTHDGTRWSNAEQDRIEIRSYDRSWPGQFQLEADAIRSALGEASIFSLDHMGSTAVPGLAAKPVIDMALVASHRVLWPELIEPLARLGYVYWAENPDPSRMFLVKGMPPFGTGRTHHVHVLIQEALGPLIRFRGFLVAHPGEARRYEALKRSLAVEVDRDRDAYSRAKTAFVTAALRQAAAEASA
jgi:GrpB-like predicted nucleotidyltransferase (UPF0157 family)